MSPVSVLLVDDSASQRAVIAHRLEQGGYEVAIAIDGLDACACSASCGPTSCCSTS